MNRSSIKSETFDSFAPRFKRWYIWCSLIFAVPLLIPFIWLWAVVRTTSFGEQFTQLTGILILAVVIVHILSYRQQSAFLRNAVRDLRPQASLPVLPFAINFYGFYLRVFLVASALLYSFLGYIFLGVAPWIALLWFPPYHVITGLLIGRDFNQWQEKLKQNSGTL